MNFNRLSSSAGVGVEGYNVTTPVVLDLAVERAETLIRLPNGKAVRVTTNLGAPFAQDAGEPLSLAGINFQQMDLWEFIGMNAVSILFCLLGVFVVLVLDYHFNFIGLGPIKQGLEEYHDFTKELHKVSSIVKGDVDQETAEKIAAKDRWAKLALDVKSAKEVGDRTGDFADVVNRLMELRADDVAKLREKATEKAVEFVHRVEDAVHHAEEQYDLQKERAEEFVHRVEDAVHHAEEQYDVQNGDLLDRVRHLGTEEGAQILRDASAAQAARGRDHLAALQTGAHAVDTVRVKAVTDALKQPAKGERYRALAPGYVRAGAGMNTDRVGQLTVGEEIIVIESEIVDEAVRVQFERGWVSLHAKSGKTVLERVAED